MSSESEVRMTDKEIIIDGIKYFRQSDINKVLDEEHYVTEYHLLATHYNLLLEDYARKYNSLKEQLKHKEQECEELKEKCNKYQNEICPQYSEELKQAYTRANKAEQECEELKKDCPKRCKSDNYKQALDEIEKCIKDIICKEECGINREYPCSDCDCSINDIIKIINKAKEQ